MTNPINPSTWCRRPWRFQTMNSAKSIVTNQIYLHSWHIIELMRVKKLKIVASAVYFFCFQLFYLWKEKMFCLLTLPGKNMYFSGSISTTANIFIFFILMPKLDIVHRAIQIIFTALKQKLSLYHGGRIYTSHSIFFDDDFEIVAWFPCLLGHPVDIYIGYTWDIYLKNVNFLC